MRYLVFTEEPGRESSSTPSAQWSITAQKLL